MDGLYNPLPTTIKGTKMKNELQTDEIIASESANVAHEFLACFQKMEFPDSKNSKISDLCVDLGDIWTSQKKLAIQLQELMDNSQKKSYRDLGNNLVDLKILLEHIMWHSKRMLNPMIKTAEFAFKKHESSKTKSSES